MNKTLTKTVTWIFPVFTFVAVFLYVSMVIKPELLLHQQQNPFVFSPFFFDSFLKNPGGLAELTANFIAQFFFWPLTGSAVLTLTLMLVPLLVYNIIKTIHNSTFNMIWAVFPLIISVSLFNNYNFPFSVVVSVIIVLTGLFLLQKLGKTLVLFFFVYATLAILVGYSCGSGYLVLFSLSAVILIPGGKLWLRLAVIGAIIVYVYLIAGFAADYIFALTPENRYFFLFGKKPYFLQYHPTVLFYVFILFFPFLLLATRIYSWINPKITFKIRPETHFISVVSLIVLSLITGYCCHIFTFSSDFRKLVASDYYCYLNEPDKTALSATTLKEYNFKANLNYNLVMAKTGNLTSNTFGFLQIKGTESLHPDIDFASENCFVSAEFYYNLGFISEARHWAYESLVACPFSQRAMQLLVKIHLVTREYKAAGRYLKILGKGIAGKGFVKEFGPLITDTTLVNTNAELVEKRSFIPAEGELSPFIETRFLQLLEANPANKKAYEHLMMYYLIGAKTEKFAEHFGECGKHFETTPAVYEEALLMNAFKTGEQLPDSIKISRETQTRFNRFIGQLNQFEGKTRQARNALYKEFGKTYFYFLQFVYPNIIETEIITDEADYPPI